MEDEQIDILFVTDTWLRSQEDEEKSVDMTPGYSMRSFPHSARGGGLAFIVKDTPSLTLLTLLHCFCSVTCLLDWLI